MGFSRANALAQALDIAGTVTLDSSRTLTDESAGLGAPVAGQSGAAASIGGTAPTMNIKGLTGMTAASVGNFLTITGAATGANNGTFLISNYVSATVVDIQNASGVGGDANNGAISWTEREPSSLEDDLNFQRTDRAAIKGVAYDTAVTPYNRVSTFTTNTPMNLENISGKTLDAKGLIVNRKTENATVAATNTLITVTGAFQYADSVDRTGYCIDDGFDAANLEATFCEIIDPSTEGGLVVLGGANVDDRIFGLAQQGSATEGVDIEVKFYSVTPGSPIDKTKPYTWEAGQPTTIDLFFGYRVQMDTMGETDLRKTLVNGLIGDSGQQLEINDIRASVGIVQGDTSLISHLTNTVANYVFGGIDADPTAVEALNLLNAQIGDRTYSGPQTILTNNETIVASLQALADAIDANSDVLRTIERLSADVNPGVAHTLPGGLTYELDGTGNGRGMWLYSRGLLRDPGTVVDGNDYVETSTTQVTFHAKQKSGDHINYFTVIES